MTIKYRGRQGRRVSSEKGASVTVALLFFLVCAMIGSVVLTAGTAAAGRINRLATAEQRHSAVVSAVSLISEKIEAAENKISVLRFSKKDVTTQYTITAGVPSVTSADESELYDHTYGSDMDGNAIYRGRFLAGDEALNLVFGASPNATGGEGVWNSLKANGLPEISSGIESVFYVQPGFGIEEDPELKVKVTAVLGTDKKLTLSFENAEGEDKYKMTVICIPQIDTFNVDHVSDDDIGVTDNIDATHFKTTVTHTVTEGWEYTVHWSVLTIKKG